MLLFRLHFYYYAKKVNYKNIEKLVSNTYKNVVLVNDLERFNDFDLLYYYEHGDLFKFTDPWPQPTLHSLSISGFYFDIYKAEKQLKTNKRVFNIKEKCVEGYEHTDLHFEYLPTKAMMKKLATISFSDRHGLLLKHLGLERFEI